MPHAAPKPSLSTADDLFSFFLERVHATARGQRVAVQEGTVFYLSQLLAEQGHQPQDTEATTLVELQQRALAAPFVEAMGWWRKLGDYSLLILGFFREHLERRRLSPRYYAEMGASAYGRLSRQLSGPDDSFSKIYEDLSTHYPACVEVLQSVHQDFKASHQAATESDLLKLYEAYLESGDPQIARRLQALGVLVMRSGGQA